MTPFSLALHLLSSLQQACLLFFRSCGANPKRKNDRGDSPYDLAVRSKCDPLIKRLAAKMGQSQLNRMLQPQQEHKDDEFWAHFANYALSIDPVPPLPLYPKLKLATLPFARVAFWLVELRIDQLVQRWAPDS